MQKINKLKVVFIVKALSVGGIENYLLRFIKHTQDKIEPHILCKGGARSHLDDEYEKNGASIMYKKIGFFPTISWFGFIKTLRKDEFDVIVDFSGDFSAITLMAAWLASTTKRIVFYRNSRYTFTMSRFKFVYAKIANYLVRKLSTKILSNSVTALDYFHPNWTCNRDKYEVIYNGVPSDPYFRDVDKVNLRKNHRIPDDAFIVGHVGRFVAAKNHDLILEVATELCQKYKDIYFLLCGKGVKENLGMEIKNLNLQNQILMPGVLDNIPEVLQIMDAFFFPSIVEGQPNALIEAMLSNLPIVASNIAPIKECVPSSVNETLIDLACGPEVFSKQIENLYLNRSGNIDSETRLWARDMFSPDKNFTKFHNELI